jgi:hypothetical protein
MPMGLAEGDTVTVGLTVALPAPEKGHDHARARSDQASQKERGGAGAVGARRRPQVTDEQLRIVPANEATWEDLQVVFGERGSSSICWCQRYKMQPKERCVSTVGAKELAPRLREQTCLWAAGVGRDDRPGRLCRW